MIETIIETIIVILFAVYLIVGTIYNHKYIMDFKKKRKDIPVHNCPRCNTVLFKPSVHIEYTNMFGRQYYDQWFYNCKKCNYTSQEFNNRVPFFSEKVLGINKDMVKPFSAEKL